MAIKKILFPTKFRELAFDSLESLLLLKEAGLQEVVLLNVISREEVGFVPFGGYLKEEEEKLREEARIRFEDWQKTLSERGIGSKTIIKVGEPVHEILSISEKEKVNLIVVGRKKRIDIENVFIGSYSQQIITRSKLPTLVSKYMVQYMMDGGSFERINDKIFEMPMLVTDWSDQSLRAVEFLASLNKVVRKAFVFHSMDIKIDKKHDKKEIHHLEKEFIEKLEGSCKKLKDAGIEAEYHLGAGKLLEETLRISRERNATMIIVGTSGKGFIDEIVHGSLSHQLSKKSELPTLLIP